MNALTQLEERDDYINRFALRELVEDWLDRASTERPEDPYQFLIDEATDQRRSGGGIVICPNKWCNMTMPASQFPSHRQLCNVEESWVRCVRCNTRVDALKMSQHRAYCRLECCALCGEIVLPRMLPMCPYRIIAEAERNKQASMHRFDHRRERHDADPSVVTVTVPKADAADASMPSRQPREASTGSSLSASAAPHGRTRGSCSPSEVTTCKNGSHDEATPPPHSMSDHTSHTQDGPRNDDAPSMDCAEVRLSKLNGVGAIQNGGTTPTLSSSKPPQLTSYHSASPSAASESMVSYTAAPSFSASQPSVVSQLTPPPFTVSSSSSINQWRRFGGGDASHTASSSAAMRPSFPEMVAADNVIRELLDNYPTELLPAIRSMQRMWRRNLFLHTFREQVLGGVWRQLDTAHKNLTSKDSVVNALFLLSSRLRTRRSAINLGSLSSGAGGDEGVSRVRNGSIEGEKSKSHFLPLAPPLLTLTDAQVMADDVVSPSFSIDPVNVADEELAGGGGYMTPDDLAAFTRHCEAREVLPLSLVLRIVRAATKLLRKRSVVQHILIPRNGSLIVVGDIHGQMKDLEYILTFMGQPMAERFYLFNGDFIDRGPYGCEVLVFIYALLCTHPQYVFLNRGNHENQMTNTEYGFVGELYAKYGERSSYLLNAISDSYEVMTLLSVVDRRVAVVHGGVPRLSCTLAEIEKIGYVRDIPVQQQVTREEQLLAELLWNDPVEKFRSRQLGINHQGEGWRSSSRGCGVEYLSNITEQFLSNNDLSLVIRSHDVKIAGFELAHKNKSVTVFSASNYGGVSGNRGAVAVLTRDTAQPVFHTWFVREDFRERQTKISAEEEHCLASMITIPCPEEAEMERAGAGGEWDSRGGDATAVMLPAYPAAPTSPRASLVPQRRGNMVLLTESALLVFDDFIQAYYLRSDCVVPDEEEGLSEGSATSSRASAFSVVGEAPEEKTALSSSFGERSTSLGGRPLPSGVMSEGAGRASGGWWAMQAVAGEAQRRRTHINSASSNSNSVGFSVNIPSRHAHGGAARGTVMSLFSQSSTGSTQVVSRVGCELSEDISITVQQQTIQQIHELVYFNRYALLAAFNRVDEMHAGNVYKAEWCVVMRDVLNLDIPWYYLCQYLMPSLEVDGVPSVEYARFLRHFDVQFALESRLSWQRATVLRICSGLDMPEDIISAFCEQSSAARKSKTSRPDSDTAPRLRGRHRGRQQKDMMQMYSPRVFSPSTRAQSTSIEGTTYFSGASPLRCLRGGAVAPATTATASSSLQPSSSKGAGVAGPSGSPHGGLSGDCPHNHDGSAGEGGCSTAGSKVTASLKDEGGSPRDSREGRGSYAARRGSDSGSSTCSSTYSYGSSAGDGEEEEDDGWWLNVQIGFNTFANKVRVLSPAAAAMEDNEVYALFCFFDVAMRGYVYVGFMLDRMAELMKEEGGDEEAVLLMSGELDFSAVRGGQQGGDRDGADCGVPRVLSPSDSSSSSETSESKEARNIRDSKGGGGASSDGADKSDRRAQLFSRWNSSASQRRLPLEDQDDEPAGVAAAEKGGVGEPAKTATEEVAPPTVISVESSASVTTDDASSKPGTSSVVADEDNWTSGRKASSFLSAATDRQSTESGAVFSHGLQKTSTARGCLRREQCRCVTFGDDIGSGAAKSGEQIAGAFRESSPTAPFASEGESNAENDVVRSSVDERSPADHETNAKKPFTEAAVEGATVVSAEAPDHCCHQRRSSNASSSASSGDGDADGGVMTSAISVAEERRVPSQAVKATILDDDEHPSPLSAEHRCNMTGLVPSSHSLQSCASTNELGVSRPFDDSVFTDLCRRSNSEGGNTNELPPSNPDQVPALPHFEKPRNPHPSSFALYQKRLSRPPWLYSTLLRMQEQLLGGYSNLRMLFTALNQNKTGRLSQEEFHFLIEFMNSFLEHPLPETKMAELFHFVHDSAIACVQKLQNRLQRTTDAGGRNWGHRTGTDSSMEGAGDAGSSGRAVGDVRSKVSPLLARQSYEINADSYTQGRLQAEQMRGGPYILVIEFIAFFCVKPLPYEEEMVALEDLLTSPQATEMGMHGGEAATAAVVHHAGGVDASAVSPTLTAFLSAEHTRAREVHPGNENVATAEEHPLPGARSLFDKVVHGTLESPFVEPAQQTSTVMPTAESSEAPAMWCSGGGARATLLTSRSTGGWVHRASSADPLTSARNSSSPLLHQNLSTTSGASSASAASPTLPIPILATTTMNTASKVERHLYSSSPSSVSSKFHLSIREEVDHGSSSPKKQDPVCDISKSFDAPLPASCFIPVDPHEIARARTPVPAPPNWPDVLDVVQALRQSYGAGVTLEELIRKLRGSPLPSSEPAYQLQSSLGWHRASISTPYQIGYPAHTLSNSGMLNGLPPAVTPKSLATVSGSAIAPALKPDALEVTPLQGQTLQDQSPPIGTVHSPVTHPSPLGAMLGGGAASRRHHHDRNSNSVPETDSSLASLGISSMNLTRHGGVRSHHFREKYSLSISPVQMLHSPAHVPLSPGMHLLPGAAVNHNFMSPSSPFEGSTMSMNSAVPARPYMLNQPTERRVTLMTSHSTTPVVVSLEPANSAGSTATHFVNCGDTVALASPSLPAMSLEGAWRRPHVFNQGGGASHGGGDGRHWQDRVTQVPQSVDGELQSGSSFSSRSASPCPRQSTTPRKEKRAMGMLTSATVSAIATTREGDDILFATVPATNLGGAGPHSQRTTPIPSVLLPGDDRSDAHTPRGHVASNVQGEKAPGNPRNLLPRRRAKQLRTRNENSEGLPSPQSYPLHSHQLPQRDKFVSKAPAPAKTPSAMATTSITSTTTAATATAVLLTSSPRTGKNSPIKVPPLPPHLARVVDSYSCTPPPLHERGRTTTPEVSVAHDRALRLHRKGSESAPAFGTANGGTSGGPPPTLAPLPNVATMCSALSDGAITAIPSPPQLRTSTPATNGDAAGSMHPPPHQPSCGGSWDAQEDGVHGAAVMTESTGTLAPAYRGYTVTLLNAGNTNSFSVTGGSAASISANDSSLAPPSSVNTMTPGSPLLVPLMSAGPMGSSGEAMSTPATVPLGALRAPRHSLLSESLMPHGHSSTASTPSTATSLKLQAEAPRSGDSTHSGCSHQSDAEAARGPPKPSPQKRPSFDESAMLDVPTSAMSTNRRVTHPSFRKGHRISNSSTNSISQTSKRHTSMHSRGEIACSGAASMEISFQPTLSSSIGSSLSWVGDADHGLGSLPVSLAAATAVVARKTPETRREQTQPPPPRSSPALRSHERRRCSTSVITAGVESLSPHKIAHGAHRGGEAAKSSQVAAAAAAGTAASARKGRTGSTSIITATTTTATTGAAGGTSTKAAHPQSNARRQVARKSLEDQSGPPSSCASPHPPRPSKRDGRQPGNKSHRDDRTRSAVTPEASAMYSVKIPPLIAIVDAATTTAGPGERTDVSIADYPKSEGSMDTTSNDIPATRACSRQRSVTSSSDAVEMGQQMRERKAGDCSESGDGGVGRSGGARGRGLASFKYGAVETSRSVSNALSSPPGSPYAKTIGSISLNTQTLLPPPASGPSQLKLLLGENFTTAPRGGPGVGTKVASLDSAGAVEYGGSHVSSEHGEKCAGNNGDRRGSNQAWRGRVTGEVAVGRMHQPLDRAHGGLLSPTEGGTGVSPVRRFKQFPSNVLPPAIHKFHPLTSVVPPRSTIASSQYEALPSIDKRDSGSSAGPFEETPPPPPQISSFPSSGLKCAPSEAHTATTAKKR